MEDIINSKFAGDVCSKNTRTVFESKKTTPEEFFDLIVEHIPGIFYWKDLEGVYCGCNEMFLETMEFGSAKEFIGKTDYELPWSEYADQIVKTDMQILRSGSILSVEEVLPIKSDDYRVLSSTKMLLKSETGEVVGIVTGAMDTTEKSKCLHNVIGDFRGITSTKELEKKLSEAKEKAEQSSRMKSEFIRNMEHDIRTPCGGIYQMSKILEDRETDPEKKKVLEYMTQASDQLLCVLNEILDFSKMESGFVSVLAKKFNLKKLIEGIIRLETPAAFKKGLELIIDYKDGMQDEFIGDSFRIHRILLNLVGNSIKFTEKGFIKISTEVREVKKGKTSIVALIVEDTGIGISERAQAILFEKRNKDHLVDDGIYQGSGLGLRIVKKFTQEIDGEVEVLSQAGKGSTFIINIPLGVSLLSK